MNLNVIKFMYNITIPPFHNNGIKTISVINPFSTNVPLLYPLKTSENLRSKCLTHFQPIEVEHSLEMG